MRIAITGATGFIGRGLTRLLLCRKHEVTVLSRDAGKAAALFDDRVKVLRWSADNITELTARLDGTDVIINLAGENIGSSIWTGRKRARILESRLAAGRLVTDIIASVSRKPHILVQASAIGFYGSRGDEVLEESAPGGDGFLADVVRNWEDSTKNIEAMGVRRIVIRSGVVLSLEEGALPRLALPYKLFLGAVPGAGKQWISWIQYDDEIEAINFLISQKFSSGVYNLVSPNPARMEDVCSAIGEALKRPTVLHVPSFVMKGAMGKMAEETVLTSQRVSPSRLAAAGFGFKYAGIRSCLRQTYSREQPQD